MNVNDDYRTHQPPGGIPPQVAPQRVLRRSRSDQVLGGVSGGLGRYLGVDPLLIRLGWVALVLAGGSGILLYIIAWVIIPLEDQGDHIGPTPTTSPQTAQALRYLIGGALVLFGGLLLLRMALPWLGTQVVWAIVLVGIGLLILVQGVRR
jgi:phage shock protein C